MRNLYKNHRKKGFYTNSLLRFKISCKKEYIPVGCVPSTAVAVSPAMHAPCHTCPPPCHTCHAMHASVPHIPPPHPPLLPSMPPFTTHAPFTMHACPFHHTCPPSLCVPPPFTTHTPLHNASVPPLPCLPPPQPDRMTDACENIIFPQPLLRTVKIEIQFGQHHSIFNCAAAENKMGWFISLSKWVYDILTIIRFVSLPYPVGNSRIWSKTSFHRINWKIPWPNLNTIDI